MRRGSTLLIAAGTLLACLAIHEFGHVIGAWLSGGAVREFVLLSLRPHVRIAGAATPGQEAFQTVAGSLCSLAACFALLLAAPVRSGSWQLARDMAAMFGAVELLGWSLSSLAGQHSPSPDDAEQFLRTSGASPYTVVAACVLIALAGLLAFRQSERRRRAAIDPQPSVRIRQDSRAAGFH